MTVLLMTAVGVAIASLIAARRSEKAADALMLIAYTCLAFYVAVRG